MKALYSECSERYRFVGLSLTGSGLRTYLEAGNLPFPAYAVRSTKLALQWGLVATPETIVVNANGVVQRVWPGAYMGENHGQIEAYFAAKVPEVMVGGKVPSGMSAVR
ncbi:MAG: peroxiredoxin family protein [Terriglobales bacterium]